VAFAADGQTIFSAGADGTVRRWEVPALPALYEQYDNSSARVLTTV
jgi:hypothetical protein